VRYHSHVNLSKQTGETVMRTLYKQLPNVKGGRPAKLITSETVTILLFSSLTATQKLLKSVWRWAITNHRDDFHLPSYSKFVEHCHRALPALVWLLEQTLQTNAPLRFMDSTMIPVCKLIRADRHRVAEGISQFGKNWQGWHHGFKLHAACDPQGRLAAIYFTPANENDSQQIPKLVNDHTAIAVGDGGYTAGVKRRKMWR
jgi:hypothetical protein